jgi:hypothetical protein
MWGIPVHFFKRLIRKGIEEEVFRAESPILVAYNIVMGGFDWSMRKRFLRDYFTLDEYIRLQTGMLMDPILVKKDRNELPRGAVDRKKEQLAGTVHE